MKPPITRGICLILRETALYETYIIRTYVYGTNLRYVETRYMGPYCTIWRKTNVLEKHTAPILLTCFDFDAIRYTITMKGTYRYIFPKVFTIIYKSIYNYIQIRVRNLYELKYVQSLNNLYYRITFFVV